MPTYEYRCASAGHRFELFQSFGDEGGADCPVCGSSSERVISAVAVHFKGSGFYKTDNASSSTRKQAASDKAEDSKSKKSDTKKSDTKSTTGSSSSSSSKSD